MPEVYGVFEGGGVLGTALVGGVKAAEERGYTFRAVAGTSAGAIVASLLASGYNADEMRTLLLAKNLRDFLDPVGLWGTRWLSYYWNMGLYKGEAFRQWINDQLRAKVNVDYPRFRDLPLPLTLIAADATVQDAKVFGKRETPNEVVAFAVRASMSIPFFFVPAEYGGSKVVDGGVLSNFPAWVFKEDQQTAPLPILGFRLKGDPPKKDTISNAKELGKALLKTVVNAGVNLQLQIASVPGLNVIRLPTGSIDFTDFKITNGQKEELYSNGYKAVLDWFAQNPLKGP